MFAYAHDQVEKLSGQLLLDTANRLPANLKRRYLDYIDKRSLNLNQPSLEGFECLRNFIVHEIKFMTTDYAQALFKVDEKDKLRDSSGKSNTVRVRHAAITSIPDVK